MICCDRPRSPNCDLFRLEPEFIRDVLHPKLSLSPNLAKPDRSKFRCKKQITHRRNSFGTNVGEIRSLFHYHSLWVKQLLSISKSYMFNLNTEWLEHVPISPTAAHVSNPNTPPRLGWTTWASKCQPA